MLVCIFQHYGLHMGYITKVADRALIRRCMLGSKDLPLTPWNGMA